MRENEREREREREREKEREREENKVPSNKFLLTSSSLNFFNAFLILLISKHKYSVYSVKID